jgi:hypothetical protein
MHFSLPRIALHFTLFLILLSTAASQTMAPSGFSPHSGPSGTTITITGNHFGNQVGYVGLGAEFSCQAPACDQPEFWYLGTPLTVVLWTDTLIEVTVAPDAGPTGFLVVAPADMSNPAFVGTFFLTDGNSDPPVTLSPSTATMHVGDTLTLNPLDPNGIPVYGLTSWASSNPSVVTLSSDDPPVLTALSLGTSTITVSNGSAVINVSPSLPPPIITAVTPAMGGAGVPVTINGTNFGTTQGASTVTFNGVPAQPTSWSDKIIVAPVPTAATEGSLAVTVNGVSSNLVPFTPSRPPRSVRPGSVHIAGVSPSSGHPATLVTITGDGLGSQTPWNSITFNGTVATPTQWSDTAITVPVPAGAATGYIVVTLTGTASDQVWFVVTSQQTPALLSPSQVSMVLGETRTLDAFDEDGVPTFGAIWNTSDPNVVTRSSDDPPVLTAVGVGTATITAGNGSAEITVFAGPELPDGIVKWAVPAGGAQVTQLAPAVPSSEGVADVFAMNFNGQVQAITANGNLAWSSYSSNGNIIPDFQGGYIDAGEFIQKHDGITGQAYPAYHFQFYSPWVFGLHTDGTVFAIDGQQIVGINPKTGQRKFSYALQLGSMTSSDDCPGEFSNTSTTPLNAYWSLDRLRVAGDGFLYVNYGTDIESSITHCTENLDSAGALLNRSKSQVSSEENQYRVLRISSDGQTHQDVLVHSYHSSSTVTDLSDRVVVGSDGGGNPIYSYHHRHEESSSGSNYHWTFPFLITNADQGVTVPWVDLTRPDYSYWKDWIDGHTPTEGGTGSVTVTYTSKITTITNGEVQPEVTVQLSPTSVSSAYIRPHLQRENGNYVGWMPDERKLIEFSLDGQVKWIKPVSNGAKPLYALADGGLIYREGTYVGSSPDIVRVDANYAEVSRDADSGREHSWKIGWLTRVNGSSGASVLQSEPLSSAESVALIAGGALNIAISAAAFDTQTGSPWINDAYRLKRIRDYFSIGDAVRCSDYSFQRKGDAPVSETGYKITEHHTDKSVTPNGLGTDFRFDLFDDLIGPAGTVTRKPVDTIRYFTVSIHDVELGLVPVTTERDYAKEGIWWWGDPDPIKTRVYVNGTLAPSPEGYRCR